MEGNARGFNGEVHNFIEITEKKEYSLCEPTSHFALVLRKE
jgi:hypothetical protein